VVEGGGPRGSGVEHRRQARAQLLGHG
jgi:hypothetical protein